MYGLPEGTNAMIMSITGNNSFAQSQLLLKSIASFKNRHGDLAIERFDGQEHEANAIKSALTSISFLSPQKLVIVRDLSAQKQLTEELPELIEQIYDSTDLIIVETQLDKRLTYAKFLKKHTDYHELNELDENELTSWVKNEATNAGASIDTAVARYFVQRSGGSQEQLFNDLQKVMLRSKTITKSVVEELVEQAPKSTIFQLLDAAFQGNTKLTMALYEDQKAQGISPQHIIAMFVWQLHGLALAAFAQDPASLAKNARIKPFVANKNYQLSQRIGKKRIRELISELLRIDIATKTSKTDAEDALLTYILWIAVSSQK